MITLRFEFIIQRYCNKKMCIFCVNEYESIISWEKMNECVMIIMKDGETI